MTVHIDGPHVLYDGREVLVHRDDSTTPDTFTYLVDGEPVDQDTVDQLIREHRRNS